MSRRTRRAAQPRAHRSRRRRLHRMIAAVSAAVLLLTLVLSGGGGALRTTLAHWTDEKTVGATFQAKTIPPPVLTAECQFRPGLLGAGARVRIFWELPDGYELDDVDAGYSASGLGSILDPVTGFSERSNTTATGDGTYTTDVPSNLLGGLLGLGYEVTIVFAIEDEESGWVSKPAAVAANAGVIGGISGSCTNLT